LQIATTGLISNTGSPCGSGGGGGGTGSTIYSSMGSTALGVAACTNYTNINTGGGTSASACLQAQLDALGALPSGGTLIIDHYYLIDATNVGSGSTTNPVDGNIQTTALQTHSNVTIDATNGGVFLAAASNVTMLGNNITGNPAATFQSNMQVIGGIWNQNQANQSKYELGTSANAWAFGMWFGGFNGLTLNGVTVLNATTFCGTLSNGANAMIENTTCQWATNITDNHDGWHFWGTLDNITEKNFRDDGGDDDTIPINTSEGCSNHNGDTGQWHYERYPWSGGNITNLTVDGVVSDSEYDIRWWNGGTPSGCTSYVGNIVINNYFGIGYKMYNNMTGVQGPITISNWVYSPPSTFGINVPTSSSLSLVNIYPGTPVNTNGSTMASQWAGNAQIGTLNGSVNTGDTYYTGGGILSVLPAQTTTDIDCYLEQGTGTAGHAPYWGPCSGGTAAFTLTTLGTSGAASYTGGVLNIPQYSGGGGGGSGLFSGVLSTPTVSSMGLSTAVGTPTGAYVYANVADGVQLYDVSHGSNADPFIEGQVKAYPSTPFTVTALVSVPLYFIHYSAIGFMAMNTTAGNLELFSVSQQSPSDNSYVANVINCSNPTSYVSYSDRYQIIQTSLIWMRYHDDGTTVTYSISPDGVNWQTISSVAKASSYLGVSGFNYFGIGMSEQTAGAPANIGTTILSWTQTTP
jgi:hypothetical protein